MRFLSQNSDLGTRCDSLDLFYRLAGLYSCIAIPCFVFQYLGFSEVLIEERKVMPPIPKRQEVKALEKVQQELGFFSQDCREMEGSQRDLGDSIDSLAISVDTLVDLVEPLTDVLKKCLDKIEAWEERE